MGGERSHSGGPSIFQHVSKILNWLGKWMKMGTRSKAKISKTLAIGTSDIKKEKATQLGENDYYKMYEERQCMGCSLEWGLTQEPGYEPGDKLWQLAQ